MTVNNRVKVQHHPWAVFLKEFLVQVSFCPYFEDTAFQEYTMAL